MNIQFNPILTKDINSISKFFKILNNYICESAFFYTFLWKDIHNVKFAVIEEKALFLTLEYKGELLAYLPVCKDEDLPYYFNILTEYFNKTLNRKLKIHCCDEKNIKILNLNPNEFSVEYLGDNQRDYLYSAEALRTLSGKKLRKKKNHINAFLKENDGKFYYKKLGMEDINNIIDFLERWKEDKDDSIKTHVDQEMKTIKNIIENFECLDVAIAGIYINERLEAFTIGSFNQNLNLVIVHIEKANHSIRGLYPFINNQFLINEFPNALTVNREDDLGLESLRKAKLSYEPIGYAKKFIINQI